MLKPSDIAKGIPTVQFVIISTSLHCPSPIAPRTHAQYALPCSCTNLKTLLIIVKIYKNLRVSPTSAPT